jgi:protein-disulfide isomerase
MPTLQLIYMRFSLLAVLCLFCASAQVKPKSAFDKPTMETYVRHLLLVDPRVTVNIDDPKPAPVPGLKEVDVHLSFQGRSQDEIFYVSSDGQQVLYGKVFNINHSPFQADLDKIHTDLSPSFGAPGAPVVLVLYSDFECPACKEEAKTLRENLLKTYPNQVRVYFKDFPLEQIHPWAKAAAMAGRCIFRENPVAFWDFYDWIYQNQDQVTAENLKDKVLEFAKQKNLDILKCERCLDNKSTEPEVEKSLAEGKSLNIDQTPTMFINGRRIPGSVPWENLKALIDGELAYATAHPADAGEKCCEVKIPSALNK